MKGPDPKKIEIIHDPTLESTNFIKCVFRALGRHFVSLSCEQRLPGKAEKKIVVISGFLVEARGAWFYVTAGHILKSIQAALKAGVEFYFWRLDDQTAGNQFKAIVYDFDIGKWHVIEDEEIGLDYSAVALDSIYWRQLKALPIGRVAWGDHHLAEHDDWVLVGIPFETVAYDQRTAITGQAVMIPLEPAEEPEGAGRKAENQFYARPKDMGNIKDMKGMSGGPVFALKKVEGKWKYRVIGVQSGWYEKALTITACPFLPLGTRLEGLVESAKASI